MNGMALIGFYPPLALVSVVFTKLPRPIFVLISFFTLFYRNHICSVLTGLDAPGDPFLFVDNQGYPFRVYFNQFKPGCLYSPPNTTPPSVLPFQYVK